MLLLFSPLILTSLMLRDETPFLLHCLSLPFQLGCLEYSPRYVCLSSRPRKRLQRQMRRGFSALTYSSYIICILHLDLHQTGLVICPAFPGKDLPVAIAPYFIVFLPRSASNMSFCNIFLVSSGTFANLFCCIGLK